MRERICDMCGKKFILGYGNMYKIEFAGKVHRFCGYNCYNKALDAKESNVSLQYERLRKSTT